MRSNKEISNAFREPNRIGVIRAKRLSWLGHILRSYMIEKEVLSWKPRGKWPLGKPKQRWFDKVSKYLTMLGVEHYREVTERDGRKCVCIYGPNSH